MKLYLDLSAYNCRHNHIKMEVWFYCFELKQWVELGQMHKDAGGYFVNVL